MSSLLWHEVEKAIAKEVAWLKGAIDIPPHTLGFSQAEKYCHDCIFRRIAILIVGGKIHARDITSTNPLFVSTKNYDLGKPHGKEWHLTMMKLIASHFNEAGYRVVPEPNLNFGRADLGVHRDSEYPLFVEVGTISLVKLLMNLESMEHTDFLLVVADSHVIEFSVKSAGYKKFSALTKETAHYE